MLALMIARSWGCVSFELRCRQSCQIQARGANCDTLGEEVAVCMITLSCLVSAILLSRWMFAESFLQDGHGHCSRPQVQAHLESRIDSDF